MLPFEEAWPIVFFPIDEYSNWFISKQVILLLLYVKIFVVQCNYHVCFYSEKKNKSNMSTACLKVICATQNVTKIPYKKYVKVSRTPFLFCFGFAMTVYV